MKKNAIKGALLVGLGASSYGALATVVRLAYDKGFTTAEVTTAQFSIGLTGMFLINMLIGKKSGNTEKVTGSSIWRLMLGGCSLGLTSIFYYYAVKFIPVSVAIVLLMQSVWMGLLLEAVLDKKVPSGLKILSTVIVLLGTAFATNIFSDVHALNWKGVAWGFAAGMSYTLSLYSSNSIATHLRPMQRSLWMLLGGLCIIVLIFASNSYGDFNFGIFWPWGLFLAFFGTILPPLLFTSGMPLTGISLGTIVASIELPVSVMFAFILLKEPVNLTQWLGIALIIFAIVLMNVKNIIQSRQDIGS
ncbi:permease [Pedobacter antarcticus 4BY]|uniref:Permease n=2 Tax=Pedobacter antarcticus TaxID=34086 RepID=A0A081PL62_9SPHI|nr:DMT family transporter [Pedobacter antarcticus]KEQ31435.1 permease [Pedobacter antarcticus 4BY]SFE90288.1 Threonine/homoserine efflux transporter RhtA [Pedobacter antarcticus]